VLCELQEPASCIKVLLEGVPDRPRHRLGECPEARSLAVEPEIPGDAVETALRVLALMAELERADDRGDAAG
jgi:hypothetical protein